MRWSGRSAGLPLILTALAVAAAACTTSSSSDGDGSASCVYRILYQDRTYEDVTDVKFKAGGKLGTATHPACDDTGGQDETLPADTMTAYEVDGVPTEMAIAVGDTPADARLVAVYSNKELPPEVQKLIDGS
ncbi:DUF6281 family protein [Streptomyces sp. WI04-05B]|uniref:DUF6281 family protein n=1 Tax=Streptomyces TaxID=1883 RepID=UPI0029AF3993|nr:MULTISPECIES: DUF6281 family protein [unclassified Streptomyces]MDX2541041.1 DUF6281 family protein [Streptomyces sp. WI04-05B]MDX2585729.1 DUF6281 family protein [Streptomyces sp. WI04-05A]